MTAPSRNSNASVRSRHRLWSERAALVGEMRSKSLFHRGEQPWHEQFCQIHLHAQNSFSLVSSIEPCITWDMSSLLTVDPATTTSLTPRLTQQYQTMTTTSLLSPVVRSSLCSHQVSYRLVRPRSGQVVFGRRWFFRFRCLVSLFDLQFDHRVSWQVKDEILSLEWETCRLCFLAQVAP